MFGNMKLIVGIGLAFDAIPNALSGSWLDISRFLRA
jgi:hypothetical protein